MEKAGTSSKSSASAGRLTASSLSSAGSRSPKKLRSAVEGEMASNEELYKKFSLGEDVLVISQGIWNNARVIELDKSEHPENKSLIVPIAKVHYPGWNDKWDEWLMGDSMMSLTPENQIKADGENEEHKKHQEKSGGKKSAKKMMQKPLKSALKPKEGDMSEPPSVEPPKKAGSSDEEAQGTRGRRSFATKTPAKPIAVAMVTMKRGRPSRAASAAKTDEPPSPAVATASVKADEEPSSGWKKDETTSEEKPSSRFATPRVSPTASATEIKFETGMGSEELVSGPASVEAPPISLMEAGKKRERSMEEYTLLCDHYEFYDSLKPNEKLPEEELFLLEFLASVKAIPEAASELGIHVSGAERQKLCMEKLHKLSCIGLAKRQKALDSTILRVTLPSGLKRVMAENYIQTVRNARILKPSRMENSIEAVLNAYSRHCEMHPREDKSVYWNKARLAEVSVLQDTDVFNNLLQSFLMRHEWPQLEDWRKSWKKDKIRESFQKYGFIHLTRFIQLLSYHHHTEPKRAAGKIGHQLMDIYNDLLNFIETEYVQKLPEDYLNDFYQDMDETYLGRIKFVTYGSELVDGAPTAKSVVYPFHMISDWWFDELGKRNIQSNAAELGLKVVWKKAPEENAATSEGGATIS